MNTELKAQIKLLFHLISAGKAAMSKVDFVTGVMPQLYAVAMDIPAVAANFSDMSVELAALKGIPAEADLVEYVMSCVVGVDTDVKAQAVIQASLVMLEHMIQDTMAIKAAIES